MQGIPRMTAKRYLFIHCHTIHATCMTDDTTVRVSFRMKKSLFEDIQTFGRKKGYMTDSETFRNLLAAALETEEQKHGEETNKVSVKREHSIE